MSPAYSELLAKLARLEIPNALHQSLTEPTKGASVSSVSSPAGAFVDSEGAAALPADDVPPGAAERRAWSDDLCRRLSEGVAQQSPPGLGRQPEAWEIVAGPSRRLLDVLAEWEASGDEADRRAAVHAAEEVALAWERAAREWEGRRRGGAGRSR